MQKLGTLAIVGMLVVVMANAALARNDHYPSSRKPLEESAFAPLPVGAIKPQGWLEDQLTMQAEGLTGHLDEFWPSVKHTAWKGHEGGEAWERGPYYLDGLVPLAYLLDSPRLKDKVEAWIEPILNSQQENGWFGPEKNNDRWPLAVAMKVLTQYHEATGDERVIDLLSNYFEYLHSHPPDWPDREWRGVRAMENTVTAYWLYNRTGDKKILEVADSIYKNSFKWTDYFLDFPYTDEVLERGIQYGHPSHVVNIAMAIKHPGMRYHQTADQTLKKAVYQGLNDLMKYHGQAAGRFSGDEHLSGKGPSQGTELCAVVEFMFSLEKLTEILGDVRFADRLEVVAYNANPGACTADYWAHQYDQQANQVLVTINNRQWSTNDETSNLYGLEPNYGCCTANMHQGWPKFVTHMWMATQDNGLAAIAYGPNSVTAKVADGAEVAIHQRTAYPFDGDIVFEMELDEPTRFPLQLRIPEWASDAVVKVGDVEEHPTPGTFFEIDREWKSGEKVQLHLPMKVRTERRYNNSASILRGPLYFSLSIDGSWYELRRYHDDLPVVDWEIRPEEPWNYALLFDPDQPEEAIKVETYPVSGVPFSTDAPPVVLKLKGKRLPGWEIMLSSADAPPESPVSIKRGYSRAMPPEGIELIPYGSTRLRVTEFPVLELDEKKE